MQFDGAPPGVFSSRTPLGFTGSFLSLTLRPPDVTRDAVLKARNVTELETIVFLRFFFLYLSCCAHHYLDSWLIILVLNLYLHGLQAWS